MDLTKMKDEKKVNLCRWYFRVGFAFLPFVWLINTVWFYREAFRKPPFEGQKDIKQYVIYSAIGSLVWAIGMGTWIAVFQVNRAGWGELADRLSFIIPTGIP